MRYDAVDYIVQVRNGESQARLRVSVYNLDVARKLIGADFSLVMSSFGTGGFPLPTGRDATFRESLLSENAASYTGEHQRSADQAVITARILDVFGPTSQVTVGRAPASP